MPLKVQLLLKIVFMYLVCKYECKCLKSGIQILTFWFKTACFICLNFFYSLSFMFENEHCCKVVPYRRASVHIKPGLIMYCMNLKASCNYIVKGCGNFPRIFYINKLFVHSINLQRFKATVCVKGKTENFGWQNASLMPRELSSRYINIRELICLY